MLGGVRVSVVVVSYNTRDHLRRCLASLEGQGAHEVVVVDNASRDGSAEMAEADFPWARVIRSDRNLGFGAANNLGMDQATGDLILLLNSDAEAEPGALATLAAAFEDPSVVLAGGRLLHGSATQNSCSGPLTLWAVFCEQTLLEKAFPNSALLCPYWQTRRLLKRGSGPHEVAQVMGACLMIRPGWRFDERFFLYCEDTELCHRISRTGRGLYVPDARFRHALGASSAANQWRSVAMYNRGKELYFLIHHGRLAAGLAFVLNRLGAFLRLLLAVLALRPARIGLFWRVLTCSPHGPPLPADALPRP